MWKKGKTPIMYVFREAKTWVVSNEHEYMSSKREHLKDEANFSKHARF